MKIYKSSQIYPTDQCSAGRAIGFRRGKAVEIFKKDEEIYRAIESGAELIDCSEAILMPGLVNAHCHLDMCGLGEVPEYPGTFMGWVQEFWKRWNVKLESYSVEQALSEALSLGWQECSKYGTLRVGDIARLGASGTAMGRALGLSGISFEEILGLPEAQQEEQAEKIQRWLESQSEVQNQSWITSLEVHAPYTCGPNLYRQSTAAVSSMGRVVCTHLAETHEELSFVGEASGPIRDFYQQVGIDHLIDYSGYGQGQHPVKWLEDELRQGSYLLAHCNYLGSQEMDLLAETETSVVYCPRASAYYQHEHHPYRDLMAAGVNVCLGTDSSLAVPNLSMIDEMRVLRQRDGMDADTLLNMSTRHAMKGLGLDPKDASLTTGSRCGLIAVTREDALAWGERALEELLSGEINYCVECLESIKDQQEE